MSFWYAPDYFERLAAEVGVRGRTLDFMVPRLPPIPPLSSLVARAEAGVTDSAQIPWAELGLTLAVRAMTLTAGTSSHPTRLPTNAEARMTRTIRTIERHPDAAWTLERLARDAGLSPYHFLRTFQRVTGVTPHQYVLRARLREAAVRLAADARNVLDTALDCGFGDISNFNRAFRSEFGQSPRAFRRTLHGRIQRP